MHNKLNMIEKKKRKENNTIKVAGIQMASSPSVTSNLIEAERLIKMAVEAGAKLVVLPEYFAIMGIHDSDKVKVREDEGDGPIQRFLSKIAKKHKIWLIGGTIPLVSNSVKKVRNSCLVYNDKGKQMARYDKIHLFGLDLATEQYHEKKNH